MKVLVIGAILASGWAGGEPVIANDLIDYLKRKGDEVITGFYPRNKFFNLFSTLFNFTDFYLPAYIYYTNLIKRVKPDVVVGFYDYDTTLYRAAMDLNVKVAPVILNYWPICKELSLHLEHTGKEKSNCFKKITSEFSLAKPFLKIPMFSSLLNLPIEISLKRRRKLLKKLDLIFVPSNFVVDKFRKEGIKNKRMVVTYPGTKLESFKVKRGIHQYKEILYLGGVGETKGFFDFAKVAKIVKSKYPDYKFIVAGGNSKDPQYTHLEFLGYIPKKEVIRRILRSLVVVVPVRWPEPFGLINIEAMSLQKPVIAYRSGGLPEIINDEVSGFLVDNGDVNTLADRIEYMIKNKSKAKKMGLEGKKIVKSKFSLEKTNEKYRSSLQSFVNQSNNS